MTIRVTGLIPARCLAALVLAIGSLAMAQAPVTQQPPVQNPPAPAPEAAPTPTFSTTVNEVSLDFVAHDKKNNPVLDIKAEDVTVTDNGAPVKLNGLHLVKGDSTHGYAITFVFDRFGDTMAKTVQVLGQKFLKALPEKNTSVAVLDLGSRLRLIQGFTDHRKAVEEAITVATNSRAITTHSSAQLSVGLVVDPAEDARVKAAAAGEKNLIAIARTGADTTGTHVSTQERALAETLVKALQDTHTIAHEQHTPVALAAMLAIVKSQEKLNERKALIYFTTNRQMDTAQKQFLKTIEAAASRSGVTIYTIDMDALDVGAQYQMATAIGLNTATFNPKMTVIGAGPDPRILVPTEQQGSGPIAGAPDQGSGAANWGVAQDVAVMTDWHRQSHDYEMFAAKSPMADLAVSTGGIYIDAQVNVKRPLEQMVEDLNTYYEGTYAPPTKEYDGSFHSIEVKPVRANVHVKYKTGYYALAPGADGSIRPFEAPLLKTLGELKLPNDVDFHAALLRFGDLAGGNTNTVAVEVPLSGLETKQDANTNLYMAHVIVAGRIVDKSGVIVEHFGEDITKRGALEQLDRDHTGTIELHRYFLTTPGEYTLEVAVSDEQRGKIGAQRIPFTVPPPAVLSDMVLVRKMDPVHENDDDDPLEPLRYDKGRVTPNLTGELPENAKGVSIFFIAHPDATVKDAPKLELEVWHNGKAGQRSTLPVHIAADADGAAMPYLSSFGSHALTPGDYKVKAYFTQGGKTAESDIAFHVDGEAATIMGGGAPAKVDVSLTVGDTEAHGPGTLAIGAATNPFPPLATAEAHQLVEDARHAALDYNEGLPNFMCIEVTNRSVDGSASGRWKLQDTIVELLRFRDKIESRNTLEVNGKTSKVDRDGMKGAVSTGEFGGVLKSIFGEKSKAELVWKETDQLNDQPVQVFNYKVAKENSSFGVVDTDNHEVMAAFHGQVFIDSVTRRVRRVTLIADEMPPTFKTRATSIGVDYDYVSINSHDYLLPVSAQMRLVKGHAAVMNTMEFRDYKRFGSSMRIVDYNEAGSAPIAAPQEKPAEGTKPQ
ncbi:VWA domain-containing protein [Terracidiphilus gabretensis]|uniref:VWA domain-containing protein n=1 Tax=Terracidiphilus gabretensis TaxID=1577687 RepID=UPI00071B5DA2|nr:VWA domain-containing protein [Terracidiphilus gabretensis]